jgi:hypothetical protein
MVGIPSGGIEADEDVGGAVLLADAIAALPQPGLARGGRGERACGGGGLQVVAEEDGRVAVAGGVDTNAEAARRWRSGRGVWSHGTLGREQGKRSGAVAARARR